jgi:type II secretory pathway component PulM
MIAWWTAWGPTIVAPCLTWAGVAAQALLVYKWVQIRREVWEHRRNVERLLAMTRALLKDTPQQASPVIQTNGHPPHPEP